jgi:hypothetical protein
MSGLKRSRRVTSRDDSPTSKESVRRMSQSRQQSRLIGDASCVLHCRRKQFEKARYSRLISCLSHPVIGGGISSLLIPPLQRRSSICHHLALNIVTSSRRYIPSLLKTKSRPPPSSSGHEFHSPYPHALAKEWTLLPPVASTPPPLLRPPLLRVLACLANAVPRRRTAMRAWAAPGPRAGASGGRQTQPASDAAGWDGTVSPRPSCARAGPGGRDRRRRARRPCWSRSWITW